MAEYIKSPGWYHRMPAIFKLVISAAIAVTVSFSLVSVRMEAMTRVMIGWDIFSLAMVAGSLVTFFSLCPSEIRVLAGNEDSSRAVVFSVVVITTICSLGGILLLLGNKGSWALSKGVETFIYIAGVSR